MTDRSPFGAVLKFFALTAVISTPFWALGLMTEARLLPGLPMSAVMVVAPALAASFLVWRHDGRAGLRRFLLQAADAHKMRGWAWIAALGLMPVVIVLSAALQIAAGADLPAMQVDPGQMLLLVLVFFVAATLEELGWTGYATPRLLKSRGDLGAGVIIGVVAVAWHILPLLQADRAWDWIAWWALGTMARRILIVWVYARGGRSVFGASLFHAMNNLSWMMFPVMGSHYDPMTTGLILALAAAGVTIFEWRRSGTARR